MRKGETCRREKVLTREVQRLQYHVANRDGWCYLCGCFRVTRLRSRILWPSHPKGKWRHKLEPLNYDARKTLGWKMNIDRRAKP